MTESEARRDRQFSPAAKAALEDAVRELKDEISWRASTIANRGSDEPTIVSILDVAAALDQTTNSAKRFQVRVRNLLIVSALYGLIGIAVVAFAIAGNDGKFDPVLFLGSLMMGTAVPSITLWLGGKIKTGNKQSEAKAKDSELLEVLRTWLALESAIRAAYSTIYGESRASAPVSFMLAKLEESGVVDSVVAQSVQRVRVARNKIAHARPLSLSRREVADLQRDAQSALRTLKAHPSSSNSASTP
ncbi:hypothetical protein OHN37_27260 [Streptomyces sp. NBC_00485]|uniref:hypothetical protein n=1 Tax=Streptomyces sp. NBC_00485 TaxID=2975758 RepID=UPI002E17D458